MADYSGSVHDGVIRASDGAFIARNKDNPDWQAFVAWQASGGVLDAAPSEPTSWAWYIDIGPFFDRFGAAKMAVLTSTNAVAKAIVMDCTVRKWIDLKHPSVQSGIDALIAVGVPGVDADLKSAIVNTPVTDEENSALRKLYFDHK